MSATTPGGAAASGRPTGARVPAEAAGVMLVDLREEDLRGGADDRGSSVTATRTADVGKAADVQAYIAATVARSTQTNNTRRRRCACSALSMKPKA